jgi:hypothetical protein
MWKRAKAILDGSLDAEPASLTVIQSVVVTLLAVAMAAGLWITIGVHFPNIWYQIFAAIFIASILAPIFLYPSYRTSHRLRLANSIIKQQAFTDYLTKLPNSFALSGELEKRLGQEPEGFAVHFVDVDRFKQVNDTLGQDVGNAELKAIPEKMRHCARPPISWARRWVAMPGARAAAGVCYAPSSAAATSLCPTTVARSGCATARSTRSSSATVRSSVAPTSRSPRAWRVEPARPSIARCWTPSPVSAAFPSSPARLTKPAGVNGRDGPGSAPSARTEPPRLDGAAVPSRRRHSG